MMWYLFLHCSESWKWKSFNCAWLFATPWTIQSLEFSRPEYWSGSPLPSAWYLPNPGIKPRSPTLQAVSLPDEPPGKPKNTGVSSLSLLQGIFPTQGLNWGLVHCKRILYQLSYQESHCSILFQFIPVVLVQSLSCAQLLRPHVL